MRPLSADVIIVGGGIMGAATAFFLRRRGCSVILLERGLVGQQASGTNFGNVRRQARFLPQLPLANRSLAIWRQLPELIGDDVEFLVSGHIRISYCEEQDEVLEKYAAGAREYGLDLELFSGRAMRERFPFLGTEVSSLSYSPNDGHANPRLAAPAFARAAIRGGATVYENTEIAAVEKDGVDFRATAVDGRVFTAPSLMVAAGAWGGKLCEQFGEPVPLVVRAPQMTVTEPVPYKIPAVVGVATKKIEETLYFRQVKRGNIVIGGCGHGVADPVALRAYVMPDHTLTQFRQLARIAPPLTRLNIIRVWSGIEGYMSDSLPIMGKSGRVSGLHYAFGFSGHGFQLGPGVGDVMAELIHTGRTDTPIDPFLISRFSQAAAPLQRAG